ncbi:MAG: hypothetical protein COC08_05645 [Maribacter sp.]|nr:MAG: hypothetical protein COC08_05645 [Maribacter sp.]
MMKFKINYKVQKKRNKNLKYCLLFVLTIGIAACTSSSKKTSEKNTGELEVNKLETNPGGIEKEKTINFSMQSKGESNPLVGLNCSNKELAEAFAWAKNKALSYVHDNSDAVGYWYEAALPNREAFCMRDVSHQAIGAEILGLGKHNYNMFLKFAQNISKEKDYCTYWEINRYDKAAPEDYENDTDFWYNLPSNFDITYNAYRLYQWTGNRDYLENTTLKNFYEVSLNQYIDHWQLGSEQILDRDRSMHISEDLESSRFGNKRGIPTYSEAGRGETLLGIDMSASIIAAYTAYSEMLKLTGELKKSKEYKEKAQREQEFLDEFWWDKEKQEYRSVLYADKTFDYFMVGEDQAFLHYLFYFGAISDHPRLTSIVNEYVDNFEKLIVELKSYLPIILYENGHSEIADKMIIDLCSVENERRDYPENSFTIIEHLTRGLMGINVNAASELFSTISRLEKDTDWAEMNNIPLLSNKITVKHYGKTKTTVTNLSGGPIKWSAQIPGTHAFLYVNGHKTNCTSVYTGKHAYSYRTLTLNEGGEATVSSTL